MYVPKIHIRKTQQFKVIVVWCFSYVLKLQTSSNQQYFVFCVIKGHCRDRLAY